MIEDDLTIRVRVLRQFYFNFFSDKAFTFCEGPSKYLPSSKIDNYNYYQDKKFVHLVCYTNFKVFDVLELFFGLLIFSLNVWVHLSTDKLLRQMGNTWKVNYSHNYIVLCPSRRLLAVSQISFCNSFKREVCLIPQTIN